MSLAQSVTFLCFLTVVLVLHTAQLLMPFRPDHAVNLHLEATSADLSGGGGGGGGGGSGSGSSSRLQVLKV